MSARRVLGCSIVGLLLLLVPAAAPSAHPGLEPFDAAVAGIHRAHPPSLLAGFPDPVAAFDPEPGRYSDTLAPLRSIWRSLADRRAPEALLRRALQRAAKVESYRIDIDLLQTITPVDQPWSGSGSESARFQIEGIVAGQERARFSILPGATGFRTANQEPVEFLVAEGTVYRRVGEAWVEAESVPSIIGLDGDGLSLLSAARDVAFLDPTDDVPSSYRGVRFRLRPDDVTRFLLLQHDALSPEGAMLARLTMPAIDGFGELWVNEAGLPARVTLNLGWEQQGQDPYWVNAATTTHYWDFGQRFTPEQFDPLVAASAAGRTDPRNARASLWLAAAASLLALVWLLARAVGGSRRASVAVAAILIVVLLAPSVAPAVRAAGLGEPTADEPQREPSPASSKSELHRLLEETRELAARHRTMNDPPDPASLLPAEGDADGDGLPNGYEILLGTNPLLKDSDFDGLSDYDEVVGVPVEYKGKTYLVKTDPLNPDSNHDGVRDGDEYTGGTCSHLIGPDGCAWDDDNDRDGVPDGLDLSPFSSSVTHGGGSPPVWEKPGLDLTFETMDSQPLNPLRVPYPFYVEIQVRPQETDSLRWAYKHLYWPVDDKGPIQVPSPFFSVAAPASTLGAEETSTAYLPLQWGYSGRLTLVPFLQATVRERDLPSESAMAHYGVSASPHKDAEGNPVMEDGEPLYAMVIPLVPVERGGQVFAFQAKVLHDGERSRRLLRHWRNLRLKWAVNGDVYLPGMDPSPTGNYTLYVYDEPYKITGLQISRQGGASMLLAGAIVPRGREEDFDDGPIALLRAGMEAQFLTGRLGLADIKARFNSPSSATPTERWGITHGYRVRHDATMTYDHLDEAVATTTMTTTRRLLNDLYLPRGIPEATLILASEQRTSTVNWDDDPTTDLSAGHITLNACVKPMITTRSLQLQSYRWVPDSPLWPITGAGVDQSGDWQPLTLDEILQKVEEEFAAVTDPLYDAYDEALAILKMATTAWHVGQTAVLALGDIWVQDPAAALSDAEMMLAFLEDLGVLPSGYREVIEVVLGVLAAGGPLAWLEQQWNSVVGVVNAVGEVLQGSYLDLTSGSDLLGWTQTAITVLNFLATVTGWGWLGEMATILTKIVEIYQKIRALWDAVKATLDTVGKPVGTAIGMLTSELAPLSNVMSVVGLIFTVAMIWLGVFMQIGDMGPNVGGAMVAAAILLTVLTVVLFVISMIFPYGTVLAAVIAVLTLVSELIGVPIDPISFFAQLFDVYTHLLSQITQGPYFEDLQIDPLESYATMLAGRDFRISLEARTRMDARYRGALEESYVKLYVGRYLGANWHDPEDCDRLCTVNFDLYLTYLTTLFPYLSWWRPEGGKFCVCIRLLGPHKWAFHSHSPPIIKGHIYDANYGAMTRVYRDFFSTGYLIVHPSHGINRSIPLDISMVVRYWLEDCTSTNSCDQYGTTIKGVPQIISLYFDILPAKMAGSSYYDPGLWDWPALRNPDPDGDGLWGYIDPVTGEAFGPDADLCPDLPDPRSWERWDTDGDGLSDRFELETEGFDPCLYDTDGDGVPDGVELLVGTRPDVADTDGDGLSDRWEIRESLSVYNRSPSGLDFWKHPWYVEMPPEYEHLPEPVAFPNPRQANLDGDHRNDAQEKAKLSSPNAYNPILPGDPIQLLPRQGTLPDGRTWVSVSTRTPWQNDEAMGLDPTLTITLPVAFADIALSAKLSPEMILEPWLNQGVLQPSQTPNVYEWRLPPLWAGRSLKAEVSGWPEPPSEPVTVTAKLSYTEAGVHRVVTTGIPLRVNLGGPSASFLGIQGAQVLQGAQAAEAFEHVGQQVLISGTADDQEGVAHVFVCVKTSDDCDGDDWKLARGTRLWSYSFTPPGDDVYYVRTYAVDRDGLPGPVSEPWVIGVDHTPPSSVGFDLRDTAYLSTTISTDGRRVVNLPGWLSDATGGGYVSGAGDLLVIIDGEAAENARVTSPGQASGAFVAEWSPPRSGFGRSVRTESGAHTLAVVGGDLAGNTIAAAKTLQVVVDDTPPVVYGRLPQTGAGDLLLSGLADDTALIYDRRPADPFSATLTLDDADTHLAAVGVPVGEAVVVGDLNGDRIDDLLLLAPGDAEAGQPLRAGLFFGRPGGLPAALTLADADVRLTGEVPACAATFRPGAVGVGDVNGDGVDDLLIGDPLSARCEGRAYLVLGRRTGWEPYVDLADADWLLSAPPSPRPTLPVAFGGTVAAAGDVNGDGLSDFLVAAAGYGELNAVTWLYLGREQGAGAPRATLYGLPDAGAAPPRLAGLGDTDGDGLSDFLIAAASGPVSLILGRPDAAWPETPASVVEMAAAVLEAAGDQQTVSRAGDVNGDGLQDMLIGDPHASEPKVYVLYGRRPEVGWPSGPQALDDLADADFEETTWAGSRLGLSLAPLGDVDGDGKDDFAFGQPGTVRGPSRAAVVLTGRTALTRGVPVASAAVIVSGTSDGQGCGTGISGGDLSGDGVIDLLVGTGDGAAYLFLGAFDPGSVAGAAAVQIGAYGPVTDPTVPFTATLPTVWSEAALGQPGEAISSWFGSVPTSATGDYRVYARAVDQAGNELASDGWYLGTVRVSPVDQMLGQAVQRSAAVGGHSPPVGHQVTTAGTTRDQHRWPASLPGSSFFEQLAAGAQSGVRWLTDTVSEVCNLTESRDPSAYGSTSGGGFRLGPVVLPGADAGEEQREGVVVRAEIRGADDTLLTGGLSMGPPELVDGTELTLTGELRTTDRVQSLRVYDGYRWHNVAPDAGAWSVNSSIPRSDRHTLTFRAVARDAFGTTLHTSRTLIVDTLVGGCPLLAASLPAGVWQTDLSPELIISWTGVFDAGGIDTTWAVIDTFPDTVPTTPVADDSIGRKLTEPGVYYGHVRVGDRAGNECIARAGPFPVNQTRTPSVILPDGALDLDAGEWPTTTLLNYDPYARFKPAALWGTWDEEWLYLGFPGAAWGGNTRLMAYLDTQPGGLTTAMAPISGTHAITLPFAADFALAVGGPSTDAYALLTSSSGAWAKVASPMSYAVTDTDTEIALLREEINAFGPVRLLAFVEGLDGIETVLPAAARLTTTEVITGAITFAESLGWAGLDSGVEPAADQGQVIAPTLRLNTDWDNALVNDQATSFSLSVTNPDIRAYDSIPLTVTAGSLLGLTGVTGATCISCPSGGSTWVLAADIAAGATQTITFTARALGEGVIGVMPIALSAELAGSGLPSQLQSAAQASYVLDHGVSTLAAMQRENLVYAAPGLVDVGFVQQRWPVFDRCDQTVEVNFGVGWQEVGPLGDLVGVSNTISADSSTTWQLRVASACGVVSEALVRTIVADDVAPTAQISPTTTLTGRFALLRGLASDAFPTTRAPRQVEVSINGGRFRPAVVAADGEEGTSEAGWFFPLKLPARDGEAMEVVARAIDEAGNVGPSSAPVTVVVDNTGPALTYAVDGRMLRGTVTDGSGVASVEVSLDGGLSYQRARVSGDAWSFDLPSAGGGLELGVALIRAHDTVGNTTSEVAILPTDGAPVGLNLYLPLVMRSHQRRGN